MPLLIGSKRILLNYAPFLSGLVMPTKLTGMYAGQSLASYQFSRGTPTAIIAKAPILKTALGLSGSATFTSSTTNGLQVTNGTGSLSDTTYTFRLFSEASDGSALTDVESTTQTTNNNFWWITGTNQPGPLALTWKSRLDLIKAAGGNIDYLVWNQGQTATVWLGSDSARKATYKKALQSLFAWFRTQVGSNLPIFIELLARHKKNTDAGYTACRRVQHETADEMIGVYIATECYDVRFASQQAYTGVIIDDANAPGLTMTDTTGFEIGDGLENSNLPTFARVGSLTGTTITLTNTVGSGTTNNGRPIADATGQTVLRLDDVHPFPGVDAAQPVSNNEDGFYAIATRTMRYIAKHFGAAISGVRGPSASALNGIAGNTYIDVTISHDGGTDFTVGSQNPAQWLFTVNGTARAVQSQTKINPTTVRLGFTTALVSADVLSLDPAGGSMTALAWDRVLRDNSTYPMPLRSLKTPLVFTIV